MSSICRAVAVLVIAGVAWAPASSAQVTREIVPSPQEEPVQPEGARVLPEDEIPEYFLVRNFLALAAHRQGQEMGWTSLLGRLGMQTETEEAEAVALAAQAAQESRERKVPRDLPPAAFDAEMRLLERRSSEELGLVWGQLRKRLSNLGYDLAKLDAYLESTVRRGTSVLVMADSKWQEELEVMELEDLATSFNEGKARGIDR